MFIKVRRGIEGKDRFMKRSLPKVGWRVERFMKNIDPPHAVLHRLDDPKTCITVSVDALMNDRLYSRIERS